MRTIAKFLLAVISFAPMAVHAAPVAQTAGSNLTQYNGSSGSVVGNQWNNAMNPRANMQQTTAKADYGNCEAVILRCAKPKCSGTGCTDMNIAQSIVAGCVNSNTTCKKHGEGLIATVAAQLQASSQAAQNQQAMAAQAAAEQNSAAMQQQMQSMQQQMMQMQQQNSEQIASLQNALAESQQATADAVSAAAQSAAANVITNTSTVVDAGTGLTETQAIAAKSGVDPEVIQRATITGQILTSMEGVDQSLDKLKTTMRDAFRYGKCNEVNGDNCAGPKRVKKFRELANKFFEPYDALGDNLEDALLKAQSVGVDLGNVYAFFSGSCNRWAEYVCRGVKTHEQDCKEEITETYIGLDGSTKTTKRCAETEYFDTYKCNKDSGGEDGGTCNCNTHKSTSNNGKTRGGHECYEGNVIPPEDLIACTVNRQLDPTDDEFTDKVLNPDASTNATIRVGCSSDGVASGFIKRRNSNSKSKGAIDIDLLQWIINQNEGSAKFGECPKAGEENTSGCFCGTEVGKSAGEAITRLRAATVSKTLKGDGKNGACCEYPGKDCTKDCYDMDIDISYVDPVFALCDTHAWNAKYEDNSKIEKTEDRNKMNEVIGLKTTVIAQQMYKQYTTLEKTIKQLKVLLEKEVLKANLQVAGGTSDNNGSSDDDTGSDSEFESCSKGEDTEVLNCLRGNLVKYEPYVSKGNRKTNVMKAMNKDLGVLVIYLKDNAKFKGKCSDKMSKIAMEECFNALQVGVRDLANQIKGDEKKYRSSNGFKIVAE